MVIVHYLSRYPEVVKFRSTTISADFDVFKVVYFRHGIPETVRSDNGTLFSSGEFARFATYGFKHTTSSPHFPQK